MYLRLLRANDGPATLGFNRSMRRIGKRVAMPHSGAVRNLVKAVPGGDGPDFDGLEQNIVMRISGHGIGHDTEFSGHRLETRPCFASTPPFPNLSASQKPAGGHGKVAGSPLLSITVTPA